MLEQLIISIQIVLIDIVMAADNAIIIGLIAANFAPDNRKKIIAWGVGDGSFLPDKTVVPEDWGYQKGFDLQWFDWDGDGWQDVYIVNELAAFRTKSDDRPEGNFFLRNNAGTLSLANDDCLCHVRHDGMGAGLGDFNQDGAGDVVSGPFW